MERLPPIHLNEKTVAAEVKCGGDGFRFFSTFYRHTMTPIACALVLTLQFQPVAAVAKNLKSPDPRMRIKAANGLGAMGPRASAAATALCQAAMDPNPSVREAALQAMERVRGDIYLLVSALILDANSDHRASAAANWAKRKS